MRTKTVRGNALFFNTLSNGKCVYKIPEGHGSKSGLIIYSPEFQYEVEIPINKKLLLLL